MALWDAVVLLLVAVDLLRVVAPEMLTATRTFADVPALGEPTEVRLELTQRSGRPVRVRVTDALHQTLAPEPAVASLHLPADGTALALWTVVPRVRGDFALGPAYLRMCGVLGLAERWGIADLSQDVRVYPSAVRAPRDAALYLVRARQLALQKTAHPPAWSGP